MGEEAGTAAGAEIGCARAASGPPDHHASAGAHVVHAPTPPTPMLLLLLLATCWLQTPGHISATPRIGEAPGGGGGATAACSVHSAP